MGAIRCFLEALKERPRLAKPPGEPEELEELLRRIDRPRHRAVLGREQYFGLAERLQVAARLIFHAFTVGPDLKDRTVKAVRLLWLDHERAGYYGLRLTRREVGQFALLFDVPALLPPWPSAVPEGTPGACLLGDLLPGERFADAGGEQFQVCRQQPRTEGIEVWARPDTIEPRRELWPAEARVFATSPEQAARVARRVSRRRRTPKGKELCA